jgi:acetylornithine deacetylase
MDDLNTARRNLLQELKNVQDGDFNPPYSTLDTTVSLAGSTEAVNVIPATGILMMHMRAIREKQMDEVLASFNAMVPHLVKSHTNHDIGKAPAIALSVPMRVPALELRAANSAVAFIRNAMAATRQARQDIVTVPFATEAPYIARHDIDVAVCGPGSIKQAHTRDEFISLADFQAGAGLVGAMMQRARLG